MGEPVFCEINFKNHFASTCSHFLKVEFPNERTVPTFLRAVVMAAMLECPSCDAMPGAALGTWFKPAYQWWTERM